MISDNNCFNYFHYNNLITLLIGIQCDIQTYIHEVCNFCILQVVYLVHLQQYTRKKPGMCHIVYYVVYHVIYRMYTATAEAVLTQGDFVV